MRSSGDIEPTKAWIKKKSLVEFNVTHLGGFGKATIPASQLALTVTGRIIRLLPFDSLCYIALNQCYRLSCNVARFHAHRQRRKNRAVGKDFARPRIETIG